MVRPLITLTGIDERTDPDWIKETLKNNILENGYSAVEFAILRSPKVDKSPRYPNRQVIHKLMSKAKSGDFAFHLCGRYAEMALNPDSWYELNDIIDFSTVGRVQVNSVHNDEKAILTLWRFGLYINKTIIMQWRSETFPVVPGLIHLLQDRSGGRGVVETQWFSPDDASRKFKNIIGYAGGLGPDNIHDKMEDILKASRGSPFWVDCETNIRTNDWFDQNKAEEMIKGVRWAMPEGTFQVNK